MSVAFYLQSIGSSRRTYHYLSLVSVHIFNLIIVECNVVMQRDVIQ